MDTISFTVTALIDRLSLLLPPALSPCVEVRCHRLLLFPPPLWSTSLSQNFLSRLSFCTGYSLFPLHIRRVWVSEGENAALLLLMSFISSLPLYADPWFYLSVAIFFAQSFLSFFPSPCCCRCCCGGGGGRGGEERRAGCLNRRAKKEADRDSALPLSLPPSLSLRQCVPPSLPPSFSQSSAANHSLPTASSTHTQMQTRLCTLFFEKYTCNGN